MRTIFLLALPLLAAACQPADAPASSGATAAASIAPADLVGEWRIGSVDGASVDQPDAITATITTTITGSRIDVQSGCIRFAYAYRLDGGALSTEAVPVASCRRGLLPAEQAVQQALAAATRVARTPTNGVQFTGGDRSVTLFSQ